MIEKDSLGKREWADWAPDVKTMSPEEFDQSCGKPAMGNDEILRAKLDRVEAEVSAHQRERDQAVSFWQSSGELEKILKVCADYSVSEIQFPYGGPTIKFSPDYQRLKLDAVIKAAAEIEGSKGGKKKPVTEDDILRNPTAGLNI